MLQSSLRETWLNHCLPHSNHDEQKWSIKMISAFSFHYEHLAPNCTLAVTNCRCQRYLWGFSTLGIDAVSEQPITAENLLRLVCCFQHCPIISENLPTATIDWRIKLPLSYAGVLPITSAADSPTELSQCWEPIGSSFIYHDQILFLVIRPWNKTKWCWLKMSGKEVFIIHWIFTFNHVTRWMHLVFVTVKGCCCVAV